MSSKPKGKNDKAWEILFSKYDILNQIDMHDKFVISADKIREYREPRLMVKFDHNINLPQIFSDNGLAILPITRGDYVISNFEAYRTFESLNTTVIQANLPALIQSLDSNNIPSEAIAINCAFASGILSDFLSEDTLVATVSGRMSSDKFDFNIQNNKSGQLAPVEVVNSQIEIDAAYEGINSLALLEAKRDISEDFLVRQLYYPYRVWSSRISKKVRPIFLVYSNGVFSLYEYEFKDPFVYNSLELIQNKNYSIADMNISMSDLELVLQNVVLQTEPEVPFPQADRFKRVINLCELLLDKPLSREEVTEEYAFDIRQTNYYTDAGRYLGLTEKSRESYKVTYQLTNKGKQIMKLSYRNRQLELSRCILQHKVFHDIFISCLQAGGMPDKNYIVKIMKECNLYHVDKDSTFERRASTVSGWLNWMLGIANDPARLQ